MNFIIICLVCCALILAVMFFAKRHMQKVTQAYEQEQKEALAVVSDLERVAKGGKSSRTYDAERQRTRRRTVFSIVLIVIVGAAVAFLGCYKQELLEDWLPSSAEQEITDSKVSFSIGDYFATYFSHEKALRYYGTKRRMAYENAQAEYQKYEQELKRAQEKQDEVEIIIQKEKLAEAKAKLDSTKKNWDNFKFFPSDWKLNSNLNWLLLGLFLVGILDLYYMLKKDETVLSLSIVLSIIGIICGFCVHFAILINEYQGEVLFTCRDILNIILTGWAVYYIARLV